MPLAPELLDGAKKYRPAAACGLLEGYYPLVHRMAHALCGQASAAQSVIDRVFSRALPAMPSWRDDTAADRWFYHFTVLESRRHQTEDPASPDALLAQAADPAYLAFIRAVRSLPVQQREAILLTYGERLNPRYLSVAMDCSGEAASNHLREATAHLLAMTGGQLEPQLESLARSYRHLAPPAEVARPFIQRRLSRYLLPRRLRRGLSILILLSTLCAGAYGAWYWAHHT
jgi:DNA-directed RNA polymerase specialized sigma24 family protein